MRVAVDDEFASRPVERGDFLLDAGDAPAVGNGEGARVQVYAALKQGEQSGFARAVLAHEAQALARVDDEVGVLQQYLGAAAKGQAVCAYHDASCSRVSIRIWSSVLAVLSQTGSSSGKALTKFS